MAGGKKYRLGRILSVSVWLMLASGVVVLLVAAMGKKNAARINGIQVTISGTQSKRFIDKNEVIKVLEKVNGGNLRKSAAGSVDLTKMENQLRKNQWIRKAELFFDDNKVLQVKISSREPIARIFTTSGGSFYIDSALNCLPPDDRFSARVPVFTSFPSLPGKLKKTDSTLLNDIRTLSQYIQLHPFWMAQIDQVDIASRGQFDFIPKLGNQLIRFGTAADYEQKFNKLLAFYRQVETRVGWNKYSELDLQYKNQVVGVVRDAKEIKADSLKAVVIMNTIIAEAEKNSNDTTKVQLPQPSDDNERTFLAPLGEGAPSDKAQEIHTTDKKAGTVTPIHDHEKPSFNKKVPTEAKKVNVHSTSNEKPRPTLMKTKANEKKEEVEKRVPKAVMPPHSDY